jgi:Mn2+/Fe2+ NRAMP family transporter
LAVLLARIGGYRLFEKVMTVCIGVMFLVVVATAVALQPPVGEVLRGLATPTIPQLREGGLDWTVALLGGVGGTLTILSYGYWIREEGRGGPDDLRVCRIDLATGYAMTALFGISMLVIGSRMEAIEGGGASLLVNLAESLQEPFGGFGAIAKWAFLIGAWGAVFSSLLGVWQSIPYLFTDFWMLATGAKRPGRHEEVDAASRVYRGALFALAIVPVIGLVLVPFQAAQKTYAIVGALVIPALAAVLLILNNHPKRVSPELRNSWTTNAVLGIALLFFIYAGWLGIAARL